MNISVVPAWFHKASAFSVVAVGSMVAWPWTSIVDVPTAGAIVSGLGLAKLVIEFLTPNTPRDGAGTRPSPD